VQTSGLDHVREGLFSAIAAGARIRLLVGDYLGSRRLMPCGCSSAGWKAPGPRSRPGSSN
jgi:hypothetical protein